MANNNERPVVVGLFLDRNDAQRAVNELRRAGFREDQIGVVSPYGSRHPAGRGARRGRRDAFEDCRGHGDRCRQRGRSRSTVGAGDRRGGVACGRPGDCRRAARVGAGQCRCYGRGRYRRRRTRWPRCAGRGSVVFRKRVQRRPNPGYRETRKSHRRSRSRPARPRGVHRIRRGRRSCGRPQ